MGKAKVFDDQVIFHQIPDGKVVLSAGGVLSVHDVYALVTDEARADWGLYAKKGSGYIRLFATRTTAKRGTTVHLYRLPFPVKSSPLGYLCLPPGWKWPQEGE